MRPQGNSHAGLSRRLISAPQHQDLRLTHARPPHTGAADLDINRANARGESALHLAAAAGKAALVRQLRERPMLDPDLKTSEGWTAHKLAVRGKHTEVSGRTTPSPRRVDARRSSRRRDAPRTHRQLFWAATN